ncbi:DUF6929 family protein [Piscinibacter sp. HJYY11]|uniref:DUF6929 family protein n=1 Tax=Piscinibacter sp. HJYY11 TaxID=2801333 RepID=UPI00191F9670|nr:hypothetical protein [Piscinibacter sp. HJYY11]MBL0728755.1 hypothetical protein [Piscinibacter sp. HJYY11]
MASATLLAQTLRPLTVRPRQHPRGLDHVSAASGLVCAHGRAYVVCDDEHHLAVFDDAQRPGTLHRLLHGDLPPDAVERKRRKADFEALLLLEGYPTHGAQALVALGSGSTPQRDTGVALVLDGQGRPTKDLCRFSLTALYQPLRSALGEINIEGAFLQGDELVLLHRGGQGGADNAVLRLQRAQLVAAIGGRGGIGPAPEITHLALGALDGVPLGFTDGAALSGGGWVFCAAAEDTQDSYADGACAGGAVGVVNAAGELTALHRLASLHNTHQKPEGIAVRERRDGLDLCLVTDADDPARAAELLLARL